MNYQQAGQAKAYPGPLGPSPDAAYESPRGQQAPQPTSENNHSSLNRALERLFIQVNQTESIARSVGAGLVQKGNDVQPKATNEPTLTDKLYSLHQLLAELENNIQAIYSTIG